MDNKDQKEIEEVCSIIERIDKLEGPNYHPEAKVLIERLKYKSLSTEYVRDVWLIMYASGQNLHGNLIWVGDMPMRPEFQQIAEQVNAWWDLQQAAKPKEESK